MKSQVLKVETNCVLTQTDRAIVIVCYNIQMEYNGHGIGLCVCVKKECRGQ
jgi:hypothetical protein